MNFTFSGIPKFEFGAGKLNLLPNLVSSYGSNLLLIIGGKSFKASGRLEKILTELAHKDINTFTAIVNSEPSPQIIDSIVNQSRKNNINSICAIGGGSVIDAGKAVAAMLTEQGSIKDFLEGIGTKKPSGSTLPFIAIPTTSGTGSEATKNAVISEVGEKGFKKSLRHNNYIPKIAILDPELTVTCPSNVTAASGLDALSQLIESYVSTKATPLTDALAFDAIKRVFKALIPVCTNENNNIELRAEMSYAAFISGITLAHAGLGTAHGIASVIGGLTDAPHGVICGKLLAPWCQITIEALQNKNSSTSNYYLDKFVKTGKLLLPKENNRNIILENLIITLFSWESALDIPSLKKYGLKVNMISKIAAESSNKNNPENLSGTTKELIIQKTIEKHSCQKR